MTEALRVQRVLVIATRQIGDVLLTTPLIHAAKALWPKACVDVLGFAGTLGMLKGNPDIGELIEVAPGTSVLRSWPLVRRLWRRYDLALVAQHADRAHLYGWLASRVRVGLVPATGKGWWKRRLNLPLPVVPIYPAHVLLEKLNLLSLWGALPQPVVTPPAEKPLPPELASVLEPGYVAMHVPSLVSYKQWPVERFAELARNLADDGVQVVMTGGPSETDRAMVARARTLAASPRVIDAAGRLELQQMTRLIQGAALYVGPDTSITHLAAACGVPVLTLFGPIDPRMWGPWPTGWRPEQPYQARGPRQARGNIVLLQGEQACVPCNGAGCDKHVGSRSECLETMTVDRVLAEARAILRRASGTDPQGGTHR